MIIMSQWTEFGTDIKQVSTKNYKESGRNFGDLKH